VPLLRKIGLGIAWCGGVLAATGAGLFWWISNHTPPLVPMSLLGWLWAQAFFTVPLGLFILLAGLTLVAVATPLEDPRQRLTRRLGLLGGWLLVLAVPAIVIGFLYGLSSEDIPKRVDRILGDALLAIPAGLVLLAVAGILHLRPRPDSP
jgi:hypothetical protein